LNGTSLQVIENKCINDKKVREKWSKSEVSWTRANLSDRFQRLKTANRSGKGLRTPCGKPVHK
jgi:hypothetical protein